VPNRPTTGLTNEIIKLNHEKRSARPILPHLISGALPHQRRSVDGTMRLLDTISFTATCLYRPPAL